MDITNLYAKLLKDPTYRKLLETVEDADERKKIEKTLEQFMSDFETHVFAPLQIIVSDADKAEKFKAELSTRAGASDKGGKDLDVFALIKETTGKKI